MGVILKVTALFLGLFLVQLLVYGVHELAESGVIGGSQAFHDATELFGPDGPIGHALSYSLLRRPLLYLLWARRRAPRRAARAASALAAPERDRGAQDVRQDAVAEPLVEGIGLVVADPGRQDHLGRAVAAPPRRALAMRRRADALPPVLARTTTTRLDVQPAPRHHRRVVRRVVDARHRTPTAPSAARGSATNTGAVRPPRSAAAHSLVAARRRSEVVGRELGVQIVDLAQQRRGPPASRRAAARRTRTAGRAGAHPAERSSSPSPSSSGKRFRHAP